MIDQHNGLDGPAPAGGSRHKWKIKQLLVVSIAAATAAALANGAGVAGAQGGGGTAKPPVQGTVAQFPVVNIADPAFSANPRDIHGFDVTGFIQAASVSGANCPGADPSYYGGTATVNGVPITIPCNLTVQMPANTLPWAQFAKDSTNGLEIRLVGNVVGAPASAKHIAGLAYASQLSTNAGSGVITSLDYANGAVMVDTGAGAPSVVQINDPVIAGLKDANGKDTGRFSAGQSPDPRFSVDQANPTIHAGTGYPMCIPRTDPATGTDPLCPQSNRPLVPANGVCRGFVLAGQFTTLPKGGQLPPPAAGQKYCSQWVMDSVPGPWGDARKQAPFEVGDHIEWSGTMVTLNGSSMVSAHTIEAQVGIFTQPGTQPSYQAIGQFGVGSADPSLTAVSGVAQEPADRLFLESETTDVLTPVDIYMKDIDPATGKLNNRWLTPFDMTGQNPTPANPDGGIITQFTGAQEQRARIRATKAPLGLLNQPSRDVRVVVRTLCTPAGTAVSTPKAPNGALSQTVLNQCLATAESAATADPVNHANGLVAGQYAAPTFEYIFPENVHQGDAVVPNDLWHLPFLSQGEGPGGAAPLSPAPW